MKYFFLFSLLLPAFTFAAGKGGGAMTTPWNQFAIKLDKELPKDKNAVYSPLSIWVAFAMVEAGADGETLKELKSVLASAGTTPKRIGELLAEIGSSKDYEIGIANAMWPAANFAYNKEYGAELKKNFGAEIESLDYENKTEESRKRINGWVENKTKDKIKDLIPAGALTPDMKLVLTNAVYFKGSWQDPFLKPQTKDADFHVTKTKTVKVPMMVKGGWYEYFEDEKVQAVSLPYEGNGMTWLAVLPKPGVPLAAAGPLQVDALWTKLAGRQATVYIPRFKIEQEMDGLVAKLKKLGLKRAFDPRAELGKIGKPPEGPLYVSEALHKAMIDVNEAGTEAAAATAIMARAGSAMNTEKPKEFRADRPFRFYLVHRNTGSILFAGQYFGGA